jgi:hypothetical protein
MNKLVEQFALDACFSKHKDGLIYSPYKEYCDITDELQNFAKFIVLECAKVIRNGGYRVSEFPGGRKQCSPEEIAAMIQSHFNLGACND